MSYIIPDDVLSPKDLWNLNCVIYDEGESKIAVSFGEWDSTPVIAIRWNGTDEKNIGNPSSSGHATWFILPNEIGINVAKDIILRHTAGNINIRQEGIAIVIDWLISIQEISTNPYTGVKNKI